MRKRIWIVGLIMIVLALAVAFVLGATRPRGTTILTGVPQPGGNLSARQAYEVLQTWAAGWAPDTAPVAATASLQKGLDSDGWTFQVYSAATQRLAVVLVRGQEVTVVREQAALFTPQTIQLTLWQVDSTAIFNRWWEESGQALWRLPETGNLYLNLKAREDGQVTWRINVLNARGDLLTFTEIRADTGEPVTTYGQGGQP